MGATKRKLGLGLRIAVLCVMAIVGFTGGAATEQIRNERLEDALIESAQRRWTGDLGGMVKRGFIRVLTTYNPLFVSYNGIEQRGLLVDVAREFEKHLRRRLGKEARHLNVVLILVPRDKLIPGLLSGRGDIAMANLTITPERKRFVAFSKPTYRGVRELVVTGPAAADVASFDDLVPVGLHVLRSSSYFEHLTRLNQQRREASKEPIPIQLADERLEDYDLLEMVNAGIIGAIIVDSHKAEFWAQVFENIRVLEGLAVNTGGNIAWAMRKEDRDLHSVVNTFNKVMRKGSLVGNILLKRYLSIGWIDNVMAPKARERYRSVSRFLQKYADRYGFDWLVIAAQGYQESKLDQKKRSQAGAIGIMQVLPSTAADPRVGIRDIHLTEQNIHAGVRYLKHLRDSYFDDDVISKLDRVLFSFAAYNAGPGNIARARRRAKRMGLDPNRWFGHVEVAAARSISREPVVYVRNIFKYFVTYKNLEQARMVREAAKEVIKQ